MPRTHLFVVDFKVADFYRVGFPLVCVRIDAAEERLARPRNDPLVAFPPTPHHGVALAGARLAVSKDAQVVAIEGMLEHLGPNVFVDLGLVREVGIFRVVRPVRVVEIERVLFLAARVRDFSALAFHLNDQLGFAVLLAGIERPHAHTHLDARHLGTRPVRRPVLGRRPALPALSSAARWLLNSTHCADRSSPFHS